jgi:hypothetical protein
MCVCTCMCFLSFPFCDSGSYFPLDDFFRPRYEYIVNQHLEGSSKSAGALVSFLVGTSAGAANGMLLNHANAIRYHSWGTSHTFFEAARELLHHAGPASFLRGLHSTMLRYVTYLCFFFVLFLLLVSPAVSPACVSCPLIPLCVFLSLELLNS